MASKYDNPLWALHDCLRDLSSNGITLETISVKWIDVSTATEMGFILDSIQVDLVSRSTEPKLEGAD